MCKKIRENDNKKVVENTGNSGQISTPSYQFTSESKFVKFPKLSILKFYYLKRFLGSPAQTAVEGFETESNYDAALNILQECFGLKDLIVQEHFNKLLNLFDIQTKLSYKT